MNVMPHDRDAVPDAAPSLASIRAALRKTTETLARELGQPGELAPQWSEPEWRVARAVASLHGISPLLAGRLRWRGPLGWQDFLGEQRASTTARAARLQELLTTLDAACRAREIAFVGLKGIALHALGLYVPGERPMADLDLLVRESDTEAMSGVLGTLGLHQSDASWKELVFEPTERVAGTFGEHARNSLKVDLHWHISERLPRRPVDLTARVLPPVLHPGCNTYGRRADLMCHLLLHAAGEMVLRTLRLIQLQDIALLCRHMSTADWSVVLEQRTADGGLGWALPPIALVNRYYRAAPEEVLEAITAACPRSLRRLARTCVVSDVSYSNARRSAFPGFSWTVGVTDGLAYLAQRTAVGARAVLQFGARRRRGAGAGGPPVRMPPSASGRYGLRSVRPATLHAVRVALAQPR